MTPTDRHNAAIVPLLRAILDAEGTEAGQWVLLESLCLGIGALHGRGAREIGEFIDIMSERIVTGERPHPMENTK